MNSSISLKLAPLVALLAVGYAGTAAAQSNPVRFAEILNTQGCEEPNIPTIPEAEGATMEQMVAAQGEIQAYMEASNAYLECLEGYVNNEDNTDDDRQIALDGYNAEVDDQEALAENWNVQRTRFLEMQQQ